MLALKKLFSWFKCVVWKVFSFRDKLKDHYQDISEALTKLDKSQNGSISICDMQKVLQDCGCPLKDQVLTELLDRSAFRSWLFLTELSVRWCVAFISPPLSTQRTFRCPENPPPPLPLPGLHFNGFELTQSKKRKQLDNCMAFPGVSLSSITLVFLLPKLFIHFGRTQTARQGLLKTAPLPCLAPHFPSPESTTSNTCNGCLWVFNSIFLSDTLQNCFLKFLVLGCVCWLPTRKMQI